MNAQPSATAAGIRWLSVIVPCRNERAHVSEFCDGVAAQRLPSGVELEVFIADGSSDDGTRELLDERCREDARFTCLDNPGRIVSTGLNRCIARARGEVIARLDVHTRYADDYLAECMAALERTGADNVGGPWRAEGEGAWQRAIAAAFQSRWVAGGARSRDLAYEGPVDTVYLGCWPQSSFERYGGFDEALVRNQDDEHNLRIVRAGGRVWQSARIHSAYRPRDGLGALWRQYLQYGYWKPFVMKKHGQPAALRQIVPGAAIGLVVLMLVAGAAWPFAARLAVALVVGYTLAVIGLSIALASRAGWALAPRLPLVIATCHLAYGLGSWRGLLDVLRRRAPAAAFERMTR